MIASMQAKPRAAQRVSRARRLRPAGFSSSSTASAHQTAPTLEQPQDTWQYALDGASMVQVLRAALEQVEQQQQRGGGARGAAAGRRGAAPDLETSAAAAGAVGGVLQLLPGALAQLDCPQLCSILHLCAKLRHAAGPPAPQQAAALSALLAASQPLLYCAPPSDLSRLGWAAAALQLQPSPAWLSVYCKVVQSKLHDYDAVRLAVTSWSLAKLAHQPDSFWLESFQERCQQQMRRWGWRCGCSVSWACALGPGGCAGALAAALAAAAAAAGEALARCWCWRCSEVGGRPPAAGAGSDANACASVRLAGSVPRPLPTPSGPWPRCASARQRPGWLPSHSRCRRSCKTSRLQAWGSSSLGWACWGTSLGMRW
jgi:hypothetical protein